MTLGGGRGERNIKLKSNDTLTTPQDSYESYVAKSVEALNQESLKKIVAARKVRVNAVHYPIDLFINELLTSSKPNVDIDLHTNPLELIKKMFAIYKLIETYSSDN